MTHLLILRFSSMGDVAMIIPSVRCLVKAYPDLKITIVTNRFYKPFFSEFKNINFFATDFKNSHKGIKGLLKLFKELKNLKPVREEESDLRTAMKLVADTGKGPKNQIPSMGCNIKWYK